MTVHLSRSTAPHSCLGLIESELFGHERGAFTGAVSQRVGRFEMADGGTLFLDEIGDIPPELQPKLLRVLQEQEFERIGGARTLRVNVRIVAATSRDLRNMVAARQFRPDLYYRLNVIPMRVPALRERAENIPLLVLHFVEVYTTRASKGLAEVSIHAMEALAGYHWPGNVHESQNVIERAVILSPGKILRRSLDELQQSPPANDPDGANNSDDLTTLKDVEREHIIRALCRHQLGCRRSGRRRRPARAATHHVDRQNAKAWNHPRSSVKLSAISASVPLLKSHPKLIFDA